MAEALRPMSTGEVLDRTFTLYRRHFLLFLGIAAVAYTASLAYELLTVKSALPHFGRMGIYYLHLGLNWVVITLVLTVSHAATVKAVAAVHLDHTISVWESYRTLRGRLFSVLGVLVYVFLIAGLITAVLFVFVVFGIGVVIALSGAGARARPSPGPAVIFVGFAGLAAMFAIFVAVYVRYALAVQACVVEGLSAWRSMKRSVALSKDGRWRIAAVYTVFVILSWTASLSFSLIVRYAAILLHIRGVPQLVLIDFATFIASALTGPLATIGLSLLYYDERVRKEAFDLQLMLASLEAPAPQMAAPVEV